MVDCQSNLVFEHAAVSCNGADSSICCLPHAPCGGEKLASSYMIVSCRGSKRLRGCHDVLRCKDIIARSARYCIVKAVHMTASMHTRHQPGFQPQAPQMLGECEQKQQIPCTFQCSSPLEKRPGASEAVQGRTCIKPQRPCTCSYHD